MNDYKSQWDESYHRFENTLFYPSEAVIRFVNKFIRRRIAFNSYSRTFSTPPRVLEIGAGSGRHMVYLAQSGFRPTGIELSSVACEQARALLIDSGVPDDAYDILNASATMVPFDSGTFDYALSVSTLDSMPTATARLVVNEVHRVLKPGALFFADVISDDFLRPGELDRDGDQLVSDMHEYGTIQSYYNEPKVRDVFSAFRIVDLYKVLTTTVTNEVRNSRLYLVMERP